MSLALVYLLVIAGLTGAQSPQVAAQQADDPPPARVGGGYHCTVELDTDGFEVELAIFQNGNRLRGSVSGQAGGFELTGSVSGNTVTLTWNRPIAGKQVPFTLKGELKGEVIEGTADLSSIGKGRFTAERFME